MPFNTTPHHLAGLTRAATTLIINYIAPIVVTIAAILIVLRLAKHALNRLAARGVLSKAAASRIYGLISMTLYIAAGLIILYIVTGVQLLILLIIAVIVVLLWVNRELVASVTAYYVISISNLVRVGDTIALPELGVQGRVASITTLETIVRLPDGTAIAVPNYRLLTLPYVKRRMDQTSVCLQVEVEAKNSREMEEAEKAIRDYFSTQFRNVVTPRSVYVALEEAGAGRAKFTACVLVPGSMPREQLVNMMIRQLHDVLARMKPRVRVYPTIPRLRGGGVEE